jgi:hypothetical protein
MVMLPIKVASGATQLLSLSSKRGSTPSMA